MKPIACKPPDKLITAEEFVEKYGHLRVELVDGLVAWNTTDKPICEHCLKLAIPESDDEDA